MRLMNETDSKKKVSNALFIMKPCPGSSQSIGFIMVLIARMSWQMLEFCRHFRIIADNTIQFLEIGTIFDRFRIIQAAPTVHFPFWNIFRNRLVYNLGIDVHTQLFYTQTSSFLNGKFCALNLGYIVCCSLTTLTIYIAIK